MLSYLGASTLYRFSFRPRALLRRSDFWGSICDTLLADYELGEGLDSTGAHGYIPKKINRTTLRDAYRNVPAVSRIPIQRHGLER